MLCATMLAACLFESQRHLFYFFWAVPAANLSISQVLLSDIARSAAAALAPTSPRPFCRTKPTPARFLPSPGNGFASRLHSLRARGTRTHGGKLLLASPPEGIIEGI